MLATKIVTLYHRILFSIVLIGAKLYFLRLSACYHLSRNLFCQVLLHIYFEWGYLPHATLARQWAIACNISGVKEEVWKQIFNIFFRIFRKVFEPVWRRADPRWVGRVVGVDPKLKVLQLHPQRQRRKSGPRQWLRQRLFSRYVFDCFWLCPWTSEPSAEHLAVSLV